MRRIVIPIEGTNKFASASVDDNVSKETINALQKLVSCAYKMKVPTFKIHPNWDFRYSPVEFINKVSFAFQMASFKARMFVKFKEPDDNIVGLDCFELICDLDHGVYVADGEMRFNDFMGELITDSGADVDKFINDWINSLPVRF